MKTIEQSKSGQSIAHKDCTKGSESHIEQNG